MHARTAASNSLQSYHCSPTGSSDQGILQHKKTGMGCHFPLQEIFSTQGLNPHLHWQADSTPQTHLQSPSYNCSLVLNFHYQNITKNVVCVYHIMPLNSTIFYWIVTVRDLKSNPKTNLNPDQATTNLLSQNKSETNIWFKGMANIYLKLQTNEW